MKTQNHKITLKDEGQDLLYFITDNIGRIIEAGPFHNDLYKGGHIPLSSQKIGEPCMIHHPPHFNFGFLRFNVESITPINNAKTK